ncbi:MAG TPA: hypothetical protein VMT85_14825 [Thermoanaerobaculia bacterium]|nr:hypothetical protein [Thermoanaerobaculia bacterium]
MIVLSGAEVAFLNKVTNGYPRDLDYSPHVREALHDRLAALLAEATSEGERHVFSVSRTEIDQLHRITKGAYSFITEGERRARLVLREKMHVASAELGLRLP